MKMRHSIILFLAAAISLSGCVSARITSVKADGFNEKIRQPLFIFKPDDNTREFYRTLKAELNERFRQRNVNAAFYEIPEVSLDPEQHFKNFVGNLTAAPDMIVKIYFKGGAVTNQGFGATSVSALNLEFDMSKPDAKNSVWKAVVKINGAVDLAGGMKTAKILLKKLETDGLLEKTQK